MGCGGAFLLSQAHTRFQTETQQSGHWVQLSWGKMEAGSGISYMITSQQLQSTALGIVPFYFQREYNVGPIPLFLFLLSVITLPESE